MASILIQNIKALVNTRPENKLLRGSELATLPLLPHAWIMIEDDRIHSYGTMDDLPETVKPATQVIDADGQLILPSWCDSHTHLVFASSREQEFLDKLNGLTYAEIAAKGGGILNSASKLEASTEEELFRSGMERLQEIARLGTGAVEIKSGYGLSVEGELKMLRVIRKMQAHSPLLIRSTFLGAHTYPMSYKGDHEGYIRLIIEEMLPVIAREKLADYIDVFCEKGFFSVQEMERICEAGIKHGLRPKLHVNQLNSIGGIAAGIRQRALSLDHLETMSENDIRELSQSDCIGTLLPTAAFFLRMNYQPARDLIGAGCAIALASDYNPGSSPSGNMNFVMALACIQLKMLPEEAINAATINGAFAMGLEAEVGSITIGKKANLILTKPVPSITYLPYSFGNNHIDRVMIGGKWM